MKTLKHIVKLLLLSSGALILSLNCKDKTVSPPDPVVPEILGVEVDQETVIVNDTVGLTVSLSSELENGQFLSWKFSGYQSETDTVTSVTQFSWTAPKVHGIYEHSVQIISDLGEPISNSYPFTTEVSSVPVEPVEGNKLVFSMPTEGGINQIFSMNLDGTELTQLTSFGLDGAFSPSWSPDGRQVVFAYSFMSSTAGPTIYLMNADGTNLRAMKPHPSSPTGLAHPGSNPKWSPDGTKIAFDLNIGFGSDIFIYDFEIDSVFRLTNHIADERQPFWNPDSKQIVFTSRQDYYDADSLRYRSDLYTMDVNGENLQRLTETGFASRPNWQAGNKYIAFEWARNGNRVFLLDIETSQIQDVETNLEFEATPKWSKSGELLFIHGREDENSTSEVQIYDFSQQAPILVNKYQEIEAFWYGRDFDWYHYKD